MTRLVIVDPDEWGQGDRADVDAWRDRVALEREARRRRGEAR